MTTRSQWQKYEYKNEAIGVAGGFMAFPGSFLVAILIDPAIGAAIFVVGSAVFANALSSTNPYEEGGAYASQ